jgi:hypothetical protein
VVSADPGARAYRGPDRREAVPPASLDYRGPDRRIMSPLAAESHPLWYLVLGGVALTVCIVVARAANTSGDGRVVAFLALRDSAAGLFALAGTVMLVVWALTGRAARVLDGCGLLLAGGGLLILAGPWSALLSHGQTSILVSPGARLALGVPAIAMFLRVAEVAPVDSAIRPRRVLTIAAVVGLAVLVLELLAGVFVDIEGRWVFRAVMGLLSAGWIAVGLIRVAKRSRDLAPDARALGWALLGYGLGDVLLTVSLGSAFEWADAGAAVQLVAAAVAAKATVSCLTSVLEHDGSHRMRLVGELTDVATVLADEQSIRRSLVHDATNVVTAIRAATTTLQRHSDKISPELQEQLQETIGAEFGRLQALLDPSVEKTR